MPIDDYPTDEELKKIEEWNFKEHSIIDFLEFIRDCWWDPEYGFDLSGKKILKLKLHTLGWSGNESIMDAMQNNFIFWLTCWEQSRRGGHYLFKIRLHLFYEIEGNKLCQ